jgi:hypothetical protein
MMNAQMQTLSARVSSEDVAWLASLQIDGAITPSDKLRALIGQMRKQHEGALDYAACSAWLRDLLSPAVTDVRAFEHQQRMHSAAVAAILEWAPQVMATLLSQHRFEGDGTAGAVAFEASVMQQSFQMLAALLRLGVTPGADCYAPGIIDKHLPRVLELAQLISTNRESMKEKLS